MRAYKFLRSGRVGPFSGFRWPEGEWVSARANLCSTGIHACRLADLPYWAGEELWTIELADPVIEEERKVVATRGRLLARVEAWDDDAKGEFVAACVERTRVRAAAAPEVAPYAEDAAAIAKAPDGTPALLGYVAARAAEIAGGPAGYDAERARQARWLGSRLGLLDCA